MDAVTEAIRAIAAGEIVVVTDDADREDEGDLICAAVHCDTARMAFILRHGCGIVCAPVSPQIADVVEPSSRGASHHDAICEVLDACLTHDRGFCTQPSRA